MMDSVVTACCKAGARARIVEICTCAHVDLDGGPCRQDCQARLFCVLRRIFPRLGLA
jgi:hypothetical protein